MKEEEEPARNDLAFLQSMLSSIAALLRNVFNARGSTIVVMVKLMQRAEVSSKTQRKLAGILDNIFTRSRLCNTADACCAWAYAWRLNVVCIFIYHPVWWKSVWRGVSSSDVLSDFIQYFSYSEILRKSVRWHETLMATLQRCLRVHGYGRTALFIRFALLQFVVAWEFWCCDWKILSS